MHQTEDNQWLGDDRGNRAWRPVNPSDNSFSGIPSDVTPTGRVPAIEDVIRAYVKLRDNEADKGLEHLICEMNYNYNNLNSLRAQISKINQKIEKAVYKQKKRAYDTATRDEINAVMKKAGLTTLKGLRIQYALQGGSKTDTTDYDAVLKVAKALLKT